MIPDMARNENRIHGFAEGDRVAVIDGRYTGCVGIVESVGRGCVPDDCVKHCHLVAVNLTHIARDMHPLTASFRVFTVPQLTHID